MGDIWINVARQSGSLCVRRTFLLYETVNVWYFPLLVAAILCVILLGGFLGVVAWKLLTGGISLHYLLYGSCRDRTMGGYTEFFSPGRVQLLVFTVLTAGYYLLQVIHDPTKFPEVPTAWVAALGGSQAIFLVGKAQSMLFGIRDLIDRRRTNEK